MNSIKTTVAQFIPIVLVYLLLSRYMGCVRVSQSILGKIMVSLVILFYTSIDKVLGLFVCALIILFYQMDSVENMLNAEGFGSEIDDEHTEINKIEPSQNSCGCGKETFSTIEKNDDVGYINSHSQDEFREQNCMNGLLKHKDMNVKPEMTEHVYPELKFKNDYCNACAPTCNFSVIESKMHAEDKLLSKFSK